MKLSHRLIVSFLAAVAIYGQSLASGVIVRVTDPSVISSIVVDYPAILGVQQAGHSPFVRFEVADEAFDSLESALQADPRIKYAEEEDTFNEPENQSGHGSSVAAIYDRGAVFAQNNNLWKQINFAPNTRKFSPIKVGIVDTGVSPLQPSIRANVIAGASFVQGGLTIDDLPTGIDTNLNGIVDEGAGHGTMVAGIILQLAPNTPLVIAKSADSDGIATSWTVLEGVVFCIENGSKVINISLGSPTHLVGFSQFLDWVGQQGSVIVSPIGNNGIRTTLYPAGYSSVICVSGLLPDNTKAPFSNWDGSARVSAPATGILSAWYDGGTAIWSGTSFSAPLVAGCIASALVVNPTKLPGDIRNAVKNCGKDIDNLNPLYHGQLGKLLDFMSLSSLLKR